MCIRDRTIPTSIPGDCIHKGMKTQKVSISFYFLPQNSANSANEHLPAKCVKYSNFYNIFVIVRRILMKYRMAKHIRLPKLKSDHQFENFKMQVDRRRPTQKLRKISISFYSYPNTMKKRKFSCQTRVIFKLLRYLS